MASDFVLVFGQALDLAQQRVLKDAAVGVAHRDDFQQQVEKIAKETPLVIISNKEKISTVDAINQDNTEVGRLMARHLLDLGHRDVAFITPPLTRR